jgi:iron complex transport system substrate-binding protein
VRLLCVMIAICACSREPAVPAPAQDQPAATPALRIVSLTPSATEVVGALGATAMLVGVDDYSTYPPEVASLPKVGSFLAPNLEQIVGLRPSLVIVDDVHGKTAGALADVKVETLACAIHGLPDVKSALRSVGKRIGREKEAEAAITEIDAALDAAAKPRTGARPRVLAIIDREAGGLGNLVAAGPGSWVDELLAVSGGENVLAGAGIRYPKLSMEEVLRAQPDIILDLSFSARTGIEPWLAVGVPAAKNRRVIAMSEAYLIAPSPRVKDALAALARALRSP